MTKPHHKSHQHHSDYDLSSDYEAIKMALADATEDVRGRASEIFQQSFEDVKNKSSDVKDNVEDYVTKKPLQSVGIALAAGFILGFLLRK